MKTAAFQIKNGSDQTQIFQLELEGWRFSVEPEESVIVNFEHIDDDNTPILELHNPEELEITGSIWPGAGNLVVLKDGEDFLKNL